MVHFKSNNKISLEPMSWHLDLCITRLLLFKVSRLFCNVGIKSVEPLYKAHSQSGLKLEVVSNEGV